MLLIEARNQHVVLLPRFSESISLFALFIDNVIRTDGIHCRLGKPHEAY